MTHEEMNGLYELHLLGALDGTEAGEIRQHVQDGCEHCLEQLGEATFVTAAMSGMAELQQPPAALRKRVLGFVQPEKPSRNWMFAALGLAAACAAILIFAVWQNGAVRTYRDEVADLQAQRNELRSAVAILSRSETKTVQFGLAENRPHGRVFVNPSSGLVFVGSRLPELASDRVFEMWLVPKQGAPEAAGTFRPDVAGSFVNVRTTPVDTARIQAVAVSVEPQGGSTAPTTKPFLIVPLA